MNKRELKKHGIVSEDRYDRVKNNLQASRQNLHSPYNERVSQRVYRQDYCEMQSDWDVGHIIAKLMVEQTILKIIFQCIEDTIENFKIWTHSR